MARASSISKAGKGFSGQEQAVNKRGAIQGMGDQTKQRLASPGPQQKGWAGGHRGETSPLMCRSIPRWSEGSKQALPWGPGRLLTAEILEEVCRVAPADPLPPAGHVAT